MVRVSGVISRQSSWFELRQVFSEVAVLEPRWQPQPISGRQHLSQSGCSFGWKHLKSMSHSQSSSLWHLQSSCFSSLSVATSYPTWAKRVGLRLSMEGKGVSERDWTSASLCLTAPIFDVATDRVMKPTTAKILTTFFILICFWFFSNLDSILDLVVVGY